MKTFEDALDKALPLYLPGTIEPKFQDVARMTTEVNEMYLPYLCLRDEALNSERVIHLIATAMLAVTGGTICPINALSGLFVIGLITGIEMEKAE